jgi:Ca2+-binding RTX toxin-like protein
MNLPLRTLPLALTLAGATLGTLALGPASASAAMKCVANDYHQMIVTLDAPGDFAAIAANADGSITVKGVPCTGGANPPTVHSVSSIDVWNISQGGAGVELDAGQGDFAPGAKETGPGADIDITIHPVAGDTLILDANHAGDTIVAGKLGINLNSDVEGLAQDADVTVGGIGRLRVRGSAAPDAISGKGGWGTGEPSDRGLLLDGGGGGDRLTGGAGWTSELHGGAGDDKLVAGPADARLEGGAGNDEITGGPGRDDALYASASAGVKVDLAVTGPQDTRGAGVDAIAGVEVLAGSRFADVLSGDARPNILQGDDGDDVLDGRAGDDGLYGERGSDLLRGGLGVAELDGGDGADTVAYDRAPSAVVIELGLPGTWQKGGGFGVQNLVDVENVIGSPYADRLTGSAGPNALDGGPGGDTIDGGDGTDRLAGGAGIDTIDSRDASSDDVTCGGGPDSVASDRLDTVASNCAPATATGPSDTAAAPLVAVAVPRQSLRSIRRRGLRVELSCTAACSAGGRLLLARATASRLGLHVRRAGRLASVDLAPSAPKTLRVKLNRATGRALRGAHRIRFLLRVHAADALGKAGTPVSVRVAPR